jgi:endo-1,4-beta-xylanase
MVKKEVLKQMNKFNNNTVLVTAKLVLITLVLSVLFGFENPGVTVKAINAHIMTSGKLFHDMWLLDTDGEIGDYFNFSEPGDYKFTFIAKGTPLGNVWPLAQIRVNNNILDSVYVIGNSLKEYDFKLKINRAGTNKITIAFVNDENNKTEDRNLFIESYTVSSALSSNIALSGENDWIKNEYEFNKALEDSAISKAEKNIELYRKGNISIAIKDKNNNPLNNLSITATQISHDFLFGCDIFLFDRFRDTTNNRKYRDYFKRLFNYATIDFISKNFEPTKGDLNYKYNDSVVVWCLRNNIKIKGHTITAKQAPWISETNNLYETIHKRTIELMSRYKGKFYEWNIINEPFHSPFISIDSAYNWARKVDPNVRLEINEYSVLNDGLPRYYNYLNDAIKRGVPFDVLGFEAHEPKTEWLNLGLIDGVINKYAALGKSIEITEFSPTSGGQKITGSFVHKGVWDETSQAEYAKKFYIICFGNPNVSAITWWDLPEFSSWLVGGGLLHKDFTPKLAYDTLDKLINYDWTTRASGITDNKGEYDYRGFGGEYLIKISDGKKSVEKRVMLKAQNTNKYYFTF